VSLPDGVPPTTALEFASKVDVSVGHDRVGRAEIAGRLQSQRLASDGQHHPMAKKPDMYWSATADAEKPVISVPQMGYVRRSDIIAIWIEHERGIVIRPAEARRSVVDSACAKGRCVEGIHLSPISGCKGGMLFDGVRMISVDPEDGILEPVANAVSSHIVGHLHHATQAERAQSRIVEFGGTTDVRDSNAGMVNHGSPRKVHEGG
jgi:hypothetical protein